MKNLRNGDGLTVTNDDRALRRALEIERSMVRLYERKLRALLAEQDFANFRSARCRLLDTKQKLYARSEPYWF
jgi:hypothetical protein